MTKNEALTKLNKLVDDIPNLYAYSWQSPEIKKWQRETQIALKKIFNDNQHSRDFEKIRLYPNPTNQAKFEPILTRNLRYSNAVKQGLKTAKAILESMIDEINDYWKDEPIETISHSINSDNKIIDNNRISKDMTSLNNKSVGVDSKKVFVVHGQDNEAKISVARFLEKLGLESIILHEQPNAGKTIIEKFEHYSDVGFAVVLLTPDDVGSINKTPPDLKPRARQNVIFELGYFFAKLKREKVCALYKEGVELPSDFQGVLYIPMDSHGAWKTELAKELRQAGLDVDMNKI